ncbi:unnamed protein product [Colias eurytheme]|nr:unnamed protein product [Colias eurytheme]
MSFDEIMFEGENMSGYFERREFGMRLKILNIVKGWITVMFSFYPLPVLTVDINAIHTWHCWGPCRLGDAGLGRTFLVSGRESMPVSATETVVMPPTLNDGVLQSVVNIK